MLQVENVILSLCVDCTLKVKKDKIEPKEGESADLYR